MYEKIFRCTYSSDISSKELKHVIALATFAAEFRFGERIQRRDGRYRIDEKIKLLEIDASTPFGATMAHFFRLMMSQFFVEDEYKISSRSQTADDRLIAKVYRMLDERLEREGQL